MLDETNVDATSGSRLPIASIGQSDSRASSTDPATSATDTSVRAVYEEVCSSYHAIDEFRMKLLGLLPLTSIVGLVAVEKGSLGAINVARNDLVAYASFFAAAFALALFVYEIRGIRRSNGLVKRGTELEIMLGVPGQFTLCTADASPAMQTDDERGRVFNSTTAACFMYALVFSAWLFLAVRYAFGWNIHTCALFAIAFGTLVGARAYQLVSAMIPA
jgi:hypothetical protein